MVSSQITSSSALAAHDLDVAFTAKISHGPPPPPPPHCGANASGAPTISSISQVEREIMIRDREIEKDST